MDFTIIIQGPLNDISLSNLDYYKKIGKVIISYWDNDNEELLNKYNLNEIKLIKNYYEKEFIRFFNNQNMYYQVYNTYNALKECETKFVIKTRSDNKYENLDLFIRSIMNNPNKYSCSNLHFRPIDFLPFHASDKLIGARTDILLKTFEICKYRCEKDQLLLMSGVYDETTYLGIDREFNRWRWDIDKPYTTLDEDPIIGVEKVLINNHIGIVSEMLITTSFLMANGIKPNKDLQTKQLFDNFNIIKVEDLKYTNKCNNNTPEHNAVEINDIRELIKMDHIHENIDGWFDFDNIYKKMVENFPDGSHFVEIGSWLGKSTSYMAVEIINSGKNIKFDAIDTWEGTSDEKLHGDIIKELENDLYHTFIKNIEPVKDYINPIRGWSYDVVNNYDNESLDFVFIDGAHDYESVKRDIKNWYPKVKKNGIISGHDYNIHDWPGVVQAVDEFFGKNSAEIIKKDTWSWVVNKKDFENSKLKICAMTLCYNESGILPFWIDYYSNFIGVNKIIIIDGGSTDNTINVIKDFPNVEFIVRESEKLDDRELTRIRNEEWKKYRNDYDWIIVCDVDEFLYHPDIKNKLLEYKKNNITIPLVEGFDMISMDFPLFEKGNYLPDIIKVGIKDEVYLNKKIMFDPVVDINYRIGCHDCNPVGNVKFSEKEDFKLLHYKWLSYDYLTGKSKLASERLSDWNLEVGAGSHYEKFSKISMDDYINRYNISVNILEDTKKLKYDMKDIKDCSIEIDNKIEEPIDDLEKLKILKLNELENFMKIENNLTFINDKKIVKIKNYSLDGKSDRLITYLENKGYVSEKSGEDMVFFLNKENDYYGYEIRPLFSIITPSYKKHEELKDAIDSVAKQTYAKWEMLICSDGYDKITENIVKSYNDSRLKYHYTEMTNDYGSTQRNYLMDVSIGKYLIFLDDDNVIYPDYLNTMLNNFDGSTGMVICRVDYDGLDHQLPIEDKLILGKIDTLCVCVDKYYTKYATWENYVGHDYGFAKICENNIINHNKNVKYIPDVLGKHFNKKEDKKDNKICYVMTSHPSYDKSEEITLKAIKSIKPNTIFLSSHCPVSTEIQRNVDHLIYDYNNPLIKHDFFTQSWFETDDYYALLNITKNDNNFNHAMGVYLNYYNSLIYAKSLGYDIAVCTNFDLIFTENDINIINNKISQMVSENKKAFFMNTSEREGEHFKTIFFITNIDYFLDNFKYTKKENEYTDETRRVGSNTNCLENFFFHTLKNKKEDLLLQEINENDFFSGDINLFSLIEYYTILPIKNDPDHFIIWFSSSNLLDNRELEITVNKNKTRILFDFSLIDKNFRYYKKFRFNKDDVFDIKFRIINNGEILSTKNIMVDNAIFNNINEYGEFIDKKRIESL